MRLRQMINQNANIEMITMGITAAIMFAIAVPIIFSTVSSIPISSLDTLVGPYAGNGSESTLSKPVRNSTNSLLTQVNSFFAIGPIYLIVIVAVGIIAALLVLRTVSGRKE